MNNSIKAGDLVMVIKAKHCCGFDEGIGKMFVAKSIILDAGLRCNLCGNITRGVNLVEHISTDWIMSSRLIKIDPPALQDETEKEKELAL